MSRKEKKASGISDIKIKSEPFDPSEIKVKEEPNKFKSLKSSTEILSELFSAFNAEPPVIKPVFPKRNKSEKRLKRKKKHKHKGKKKKKKASKHESSSYSSSDIEEVEIPKKLKIRTYEKDYESDSPGMDDDFNGRFDANMKNADNPDINDKPKPKILTKSPIVKQKEKHSDDINVKSTVTNKITIKNLKFSSVCEQNVKRVEKESQEKDEGSDRLKELKKKTAQKYLDRVNQLKARLESKYNKINQKNSSSDKKSHEKSKAASRSRSRSSSESSSSSTSSSRSVFNSPKRLKKSKSRTKSRSLSKSSSSSKSPTPKKKSRTRSRSRSKTRLKSKSRSRSRHRHRSRSKSRTRSRSRNKRGSRERNIRDRNKRFSHRYVHNSINRRFKDLRYERTVNSYNKNYYNNNYKGANNFSRRSINYNSRAKNYSSRSSKYYRSPGYGSKGRSRSRSRTRSRSRSRSRSRTRSHSRSVSRSKSKSVSKSKSRSKSRSKTRSKSRSRSRSPNRKVASSHLEIDKKKLLAIARKNAIQMLKSGTLPGSAGLNKRAQEKVVAAIKIGGKSVEELTDFCKNLSQNEDIGELSSVSSGASDHEEEVAEKPFHHPFLVKDKGAIVMNIKNAVQIPIKTPQEKNAEQVKTLRMQFPVSSGTQHRRTENEWVPVSPPSTKINLPKTTPLPSPVKLPHVAALQASTSVPPAEMVQTPTDTSTSDLPVTTELPSTATESSTAVLTAASSTAASSTAASSTAASSTAVLSTAVSSPAVSSTAEPSTAELSNAVQISNETVQVPRGSSISVSSPAISITSEKSQNLALQSFSVSSACTSDSSTVQHTPALPPPPDVPASLAAAMEEKPLGDITDEIKNIQSETVTTYPTYNQMATNNSYSGYNMNYAYSAYMNPQQSQMPNNQVFNTAQAPNLDISTIISQRLMAMRRLQENPSDISAMNDMYNVQQSMSMWVNSKYEPGQFTGSTDANILSAKQLQSGAQAWARKDQLQNAAPVSGGMGMHLLQKMGWKPGEGLGKDKSGSLQPLMLEVKLDKRGLVSNEDIITRPFIPRPVKKAPVYSLDGKHPVSLLGEYASKKKLGAPCYELCFESGPDHKKNFLFKVKLNGMVYQPSVANNNKKQAKADAALLCLQQLGVLPSK